MVRIQYVCAITKGNSKTNTFMLSLETFNNLINHHLPASHPTNLTNYEQHHQPYQLKHYSDLTNWKLKTLLVGSNCSD